MKNKSITHWIVLAVMCGLTGSAVGICTNTVGIFYTSVSESLGVYRGTFALQSTLALFVTGTAALFMPSAMKKLPYKPILIAGVLLAVLSTVAMSFSRSVLLFYLLGVLRGVGVAVFSNVSVTMIINNWFEEKHGLATSIALSFSGVVGALVSPLLGWCIESFGWSRTYLIQAGIILLLALPAILFPFTLYPSGMGLLPYGHRGETPPAQGTAARQSRFNFLSLAFLCFALFTFFDSAISAMGQHLAGFAEHAGFSTAIGSTLVSFAMIGNISFKLAVGRISDRVGPLKASISMILLNAVSLALLFLGGAAGSRAMLSFSSFLFGTIYAVSPVGVALLTKRFFGVENYGTIYPKISLLSNMGLSTSLTLIGYVFDFTGSYHAALWGSAVLHAADLLLLLVIVRRLKVSRR